MPHRNRSRLSGMDNRILFLRSNFGPKRKSTGKKNKNKMVEGVRRAPLKPSKGFPETAKKAITGCKNEKRWCQLRPSTNALITVSLVLEINLEFQSFIVFVPRKPR